MSLSTEAIPQQAKRAVLQTTAVSLKKEFIGLDSIIDHIIKLITPWYLYPHLQKRPLVINLWGMTGVGKTSLVKRLVECLCFEEQFYLFDMGANSPAIDTLKTFFKILFEKKNGFPFILGLDEFQYANTKQGNGEELEKSYSRVVWEMLDTGKFQAYRERFNKVELSSTISELKFLLSKGVKVEGGLVVKNINYYLTVVSPERSRWHGGDEEDDAEIELNVNSNKKTVLKKLLFLKESIVEEIFSHCSDIYQHKIELRDALMRLNGEETITFLESAERHAKSRKEIDASKALVFVMGNLDEAYQFADVLNPDISADEFFRRSKQITLQTIKAALQIRFRNEQIGRLGNNHIIYPALSKKAYEQIIISELKKLSLQFRDECNITISFHKSIEHLLYKEGVYPTQGTRPLFSSIQYLIGSNIALLPSVIEEHMLSADNIKMGIKGNVLWLHFFKEAKLLFIHKEKLVLSLQKLRQSKNDELQAVTAVHESGHAIASALLMGIFPTQILSISADQNAAGMVLTETKKRMVWSKKSIFQKASVLLAGLCAEAIVFGEENVSAGAESDIKTATRLISHLVKKQGMGGYPFYVEVEDVFTSNAVFDEQYECNKEVKELIQTAYDNAMSLLRQNKALLLDVSKCLATHSFMTKKVFMARFKSFMHSKNECSKMNAFFSYRNMLMQSDVNTVECNEAINDSRYISLNKNVPASLPE